jgi:hypothetical protein
MQMEVAGQQVDHVWKKSEFFKPAKRYRAVVVSGVPSFNRPAHRITGRDDGDASWRLPGDNAAVPRLSAGYRQLVAPGCRRTGRDSCLAGAKLEPPSGESNRHHQWLALDRCERWRAVCKLVKSDDLRNPAYKSHNNNLESLNS